MREGPVERAATALLYTIAWSVVLADVARNGHDHMHRPRSQRCTFLQQKEVRVLDIANVRELDDHQRKWTRTRLAPGPTAGPVVTARQHVHVHKLGTSQQTTKSRTVKAASATSLSQFRSCFALCCISRASWMRAFSLSGLHRHLCSPHLCRHTRTFTATAARLKLCMRSRTIRRLECRIHRVRRRVCRACRACRARTRRRRSQVGPRSGST